VAVVCSRSGATRAASAASAIAMRRSSHTRIDVDTYLGLLAVDGTLVNVSAPTEPLSLNVFSAEHHIGAEVEVIPANQVNEAYQCGDYGCA
jgi:D-arabinose 1-dehydrogenase-like Zn-dependent alcohol dehydrogenase